MRIVSDVTQAYSEAWSQRTPLVGIYILLSLVVIVLVAPVLSAITALAISFSDQSALTDQDIARFVLSPGGFVAAVAVLSLYLIAQVFGFAVMTALLRTTTAGQWQSLRAAFVFVIRRLHILLVFAVHFLLRIVLLTVPFVVAALFVAKLYLTEFDINYYLSQRPPEFVLAAGLIGAIVLAMGLLLLSFFSNWAVSLHLVLFDGERPRTAFSRSASLIKGNRRRLAGDILLWGLVRFVLLAVLALIASALPGLVPLKDGVDLRLALIIGLVVLTLWALARLAVAALALGALASLFDGFFDAGRPRLQVADLGPVRPGRRSLPFVIFALGVAGFSFWVSALLLDQVQAEDNVEIIAHRGAAGSRPENTLASVRRAIEEQTDWVEIDVQETADDQVVVVHDSDFMKLAGVNLKVWDATFDDLAQIDVGSWFDTAYASERVPLLRDVLAMAKGRAKVIIELKYYGHDKDLEARVAQIVEEQEMADQIAIMSLKYPAVLKMQTLRPGWRTGVLAATAVGDLSGLAADFVAVNSSLVTRRLIRSIEASGKDLYVWTVNDPLEMSKMISMGVSGLITDEPALAREVLAIRASLNTPERLVLWLSQELGLELNDKDYRDRSP